jgi:hypothetical protein
MKKKAQVDTTITLFVFLILLGIMLYSVSPLIDAFRITVLASPTAGTLLKLVMYFFFPFAYGVYLLAWIISIRMLIATGGE